MLVTFFVSRNRIMVGGSLVVARNMCVSLAVAIFMNMVVARNGVAVAGQFTGVVRMMPAAPKHEVHDQRIAQH